MSLETKLIALAQAVGADVKTLTDNQGSLTALSTTAKSTLVAAINEIYAELGALIDDAAGTAVLDKTWSASKINNAISAATQALKTELTDGASAALDTLNELANALGNDPNFATTIATELGNRVRFDAPQTLTTAEQLQACTNIGVGNPEADLVSSYTTARDAV